MSFAVNINSVDRTSKISFKSFRKKDSLNQQVDTCESFINKVGSSTYSPTLGHEVSVVRDGTTIFGGVIVRITETVEAAVILGYRVECADFSQYLKRQRVTERYENMTVAAIIANLITTYTTDGFTVVNAASTLTITSISFNRLTVAECLQKLAEAVSYVWYVDYTKDIHFFPKNTESAPYNLSDTSQNYIYDSLEIVEDLTQVRNSVLVQGGEAVAPSTRTEYWSGDATRTHFPLSNKFASLPTVTVGGSPQTVGVEYLDDDASFDCLWNFNEKYLRFTAGNIPVAGTNNIVITGYYLYPIVVSVPAPASQVAYGVYEFAITDKSIRSQAEAIARAQAELTSYATTLYEGQFRTYTDGLRSGQVITINSTQRGKSIEVLIQSVGAKMRDPLGTQLEYTVRFATLRSIGIIDYLQGQLRQKEVIVDDDEVLLNFYPFTDEVDSADSIATPTHTSPPYVWAFVQNKDFVRQPTYVADTTAFAVWIDGTAAGSAVNDNWKWATAIAGSASIAARYDTIGGRTCIKMAASSMDKAGVTVDQVMVIPINVYPGGSIATSHLNNMIPVTAGLSYTLSGDYYITAVSHTADIVCNIVVTWYNSSGTRINTSQTGNGNNASLNAWNSLSSSVTAPVGATYAVVRGNIQTTGADGTGRSMTVYFSNINMARSGYTLLEWGYGTWG